MSKRRGNLINASVKFASGDILRLGETPDVVYFGKDLFQSEDLVAQTYEVYLALTVEKGWEGDAGGSIEDFGIAYADGLYVCGIRRAIITHQYDPLNDTVPSSFAVWMGDKCVDCMREIPRLPRDWRSAAHGRHFRLTTLDLSHDPAQTHTSVVTLMSDGRIVPAIPAHFATFEQLMIPGASSLLSSVSINLFCDRQHLWQVTTEEKVLTSHKTPLSIGVSEDHIKSLFYARSLPVTESGRKRPILHWVRAHLRRMSAGIEIDISRHLRGIDRFEMGGFDWAITNPVKRQKEAAP